ncbi:CBS domain-containing protein, partial [bacterium]|nr:CBS domain-containing protein [bacterium]
MALSAVDLMASPPITVGAKDSILDAKATLTRFDINAVPVMAGRRIVGVLNRQIADKALHHGLTDAPVSKVMESDVPSVAPDATIAEMMPLVRGRRRLLCVVDNGDLVGVVTRTEIYRAQIEGEDAVRPRQRRVAAHPSTNVADAAERTLPPGVLARIREIGRIAAEAGGLAYMVGGCVRDLLLARANLDIDIAVEGDARAVATAAVKRLGGKVQKHEPFLVAKITFDDGSKIDLATARVEHYAKPGRLPTVERSSIRKDLARRDFTINTLAIRIDPDAFGHLIDDLGGLGDLE